MNSIEILENPVDGKRCTLQRNAPDLPSDRSDVSSQERGCINSSGVSGHKDYFKPF